jgi:peptidoglycan/LPS O-acetylase OafA/YrhL
LLLVQNFFVSEGGNQLLGVLWTLPLELQMYLLLPILFLILRRITSTRMLLVAWGVSTLISLGAPPTLLRLFGPTVLSLDWGWVVLPTLLEFTPAFLAGALAYAFWRRPERRLPFAVLPLLLSAFVASYAAAIDIQAPGRVPVAVWMVFCLGVALLLPCIAEPKLPWVRPISAIIAKYSYGIYLVHVPCIWLSFDVLRDEALILQWFVFLFSTPLVSAALYHAVERPFISLGARLGRRWSGVERTSIPAPDQQRSLA